MNKPLIKAPTQQEFKYITFVEHYWHATKEFPTPKKISDALNWQIDTVLKIQKSDTVQAMLSNRGISIETADRDVLSKEQIDAALCYLNVADQRPLRQKLISLGIEPVKFYGWMKGKNFKLFLREKAEELFEDGMPFAHRELMAKVMNGDLKAIRLFYEVSGRHLGAETREQQNATILIQRLIEAVQMEVQDSETIQRIAARFKAISQGEAPTIQRPLSFTLDNISEQNYPAAPAQKAIKWHAEPDTTEGLGDSI